MQLNNITLTFFFFFGFFGGLLIFFTFTGDLITRHIHIFKMNEFFKGITLPQPDTLEPLEVKIPKENQNDPAVLDFLKVKLTD